VRRKEDRVTWYQIVKPKRGRPGAWRDVVGTATFDRPATGALLAALGLPRPLVRVRADGGGVRLYVRGGGALLRVRPKPTCRPAVHSWATFYMKGEDLRELAEGCRAHVRETMHPAPTYWRLLNGGLRVHVGSIYAPPREPSKRPLEPRAIEDLDAAIEVVCAGLAETRLGAISPEHYGLGAVRRDPEFVDAVGRGEAKHRYYAVEDGRAWRVVTAWGSEITAVEGIDL
jgi:hypothetical protein